jgi:hypothetical protein
VKTTTAVINKLRPALKRIAEFEVGVVGGVEEDPLLEEFLVTNPTVPAGKVTFELANGPNGTVS